MTDLLFTAVKIIAVWNVFTFAVMGIDKLMAKLDRRRIPEDFIIFTAFAMGSFGVAIGSWLFSHKMSKRRFNILIPVAVLFNLSLCFLLYHYDFPPGWWR